MPCCCRAVRPLGLPRHLKVAPRDGYRLFQKDGAGKQGRGSRCMQRGDSNLCSLERAMSQPRAYA